MTHRRTRQGTLPPWLPALVGIAAGALIVLVVLIAWSLIRFTQAYT